MNSPEEGGFFLEREVTDVFDDDRGQVVIAGTETLPCRKVLSRPPEGLRLSPAIMERLGVNYTDNVVDVASAFETTAATIRSFAITTIRSSLPRRVRTSCTIGAARVVLERYQGSAD